MAVQLYFGPGIDYANLPHTADKNNFAITVNNRVGKLLNLTITLSNSGPDALQVYINLYSRVCVPQAIATFPNADTTARMAMGGTATQWCNQFVPQLSTWSSGPFPYQLVGAGTAYLLVATLTCQPLGEAPTLSAVTQDPCAAVMVGLL